MKILKNNVFGLLFVILNVATVDAAELLLFEENGCEWCEEWDKEVGKTYHKTKMGILAPLRRLNINDPRPPNLKIIKGVVFTPTFVLLDNGLEIGRIIGFISEYQFWSLMEELIKKLQKSTGLVSKTQL